MATIEERLKRMREGKTSVRQDTASITSGSQTAQTGQPTSPVSTQDESGSGTVMERLERMRQASQIQGFNSWLADMGTMSRRISEDYAGRDGQYQDAARFGQYRDDMDTGIKRLQDQADAYRKYFDTSGRAAYGDETVEQILSALDEGSGYLRDVGASLGSEYDYWAQFKNERDYNDRVAQQKEYERLSGLDVAGGKKALEGLQAQLKEAKQAEQDTIKAANNQSFDVTGIAVDMNPEYEKAVNAAHEAAGVREGIEKQITALQRELQQAESVQAANRYNAYMNEGDFEQYSAQGAAIENPSVQEANRSLKNWFPAEVGNIVTYSRDNWESIAEAENDPEGGHANHAVGNYLYHYMTDDEVSIYNYLLAKNGQKSAQEYLDHLEETLNYRVGIEQAGKVRDIDNAAARTLATGFYGVGAGLDQWMSGTKQLFSEERLPTSANQYGSAYIREDLADTGPQILGNSLGQAAYDAVTTTANMAPSILLSSLTAGLGAPAAVASGIGAATLGASAGGNAYNQALQEGYTPGEARNYAALIGASEAGLQYVLGGIGSLGGKLTGKTAQAAVQNIDNALLRISADIGINMFGEGAEEYLQDILEPAFRNLVFDESNEIKLVSEEAAYSFLLGALTAGLMEGGHITAADLNLGKTGAAIKSTGLYEALLENALSLDPSSEVYQMASKMRSGSLHANDVNIGQLFASYAEAGGSMDFMTIPDAGVEQQTAAAAADELLTQAAEQAAQNGSVSGKLADRILADTAALEALARETGLELSDDMTMSQRRAAVKSATESLAGRRENTGSTAAQTAQERAQARPVAKQAYDIKRIQRAASSLGENGAKALNAVYDGSVSADTFYGGFAAYYEAGVSGLDMDKVRSEYGAQLNEAQKYAAYAAGQNDAALAESQAVRYTENTEGVTPHGEEAYLRDGGQRDGSTDPGGPVRAVEESAGRDQSGQAEVRSADSAAASLTFGEKVSTASLGISRGSDVANIRIVTGGKTAATRSAKALAKERGLRLTLFSGDNMSIRQADGSWASVRGYISGDRAFVRVDHPRYTADQLMRHEAGHDMIAKGEVNPDDVRARIEETFGEDKAGALSQLYADAYEGSGLTAEEIWEEVICDSLGDMNIFAETLDESIAQELLEETKNEASADLEVNRTRGPPTQEGAVSEEGKASQESLSAKYDYETLVAKPDMDLAIIDDTVQYRVNSQTRKDIVRQAIKNAAAIGNTNERGEVSVYVNDVGGEVMLSTHGLQHGLDRRLQLNAAATLKAGEILQNAIRINELTPKHANAADSYVLLGAAKNAANVPYIVEFVVNRFDNTLTSMDVLYSVNAKKESAVRNAPAITGNPLRITDSTISIAQLLDLARANFPDILPESVLRHYGYDARPDGKLGESALYSRELDRVDQLREQKLADDMYYGRKMAQSQRMNQEKAATAKQEARQRVADTKLADDMYYGRRISELRRQRDAKVENLKEHYREKDAARRERTADSKARTRLLNIAKRLKNRKLPAVNRALLNQYIGELDTTAKSLTDKSVVKLSDLQAWYENEKTNNPDFISDPSVEKALARLSQKQIADLTADEVADLTNVLLNIENELRTQKKLIDREERRDTYQLGLEVISDVENTKGSSAGKLGAPGRYIVTETLSPVRQVRRMTGWVDSDPLYTLTNDLADGQRRMFDYQRRAGELFTKWTEDQKLTERITGKKAEEIEITGIGKDGPTTVRITPAMRMSLYLHSLNDQNLKHIAGGGVTVPDMALYKKGKIAEAYARGVTIKLTPSEVRSITTQMSEKERAFAAAARRYFNGMSQQSINEVSEKLKGYSLARVENYFPINTDTSFTRSDFESLKFDGTIEGMGFLKERINSAAPILLRDMNSVLTQSIDSTAKYVGLAIPVRNFNKVWGVTKASYDEEGNRTNYQSSVQQAVKQKWGEDGYSYIENMMTDLNSGRPAQDKWAKALGKIKSNYAGAVLTLNASVAMKQAASYPTAGAVLGWKPLIKAMKDFGKVDLDLINQYTPLQWYRTQGFSTQELGDMAKRNKSLPKVLNWVQGVDLLTTRKLWKASEYYVRAEQKDLGVGTDAYYKAVADIYNRVIEETQPNYTTMQRPQLLRSENTLMQNLSMFKTQPFQNFNILYDAMGNLNAKKAAYDSSGSSEAKAAYVAAKKNAGRALTSQFVQLAVFAGMTFAWNMFRGKGDKYEDDEDEMTTTSVLAGIGKDMVGGAFSVVPFGSDVWELLSSKFFDDAYYGMDAVTVTALTDAISSFSGVADMLTDTVTALANGEAVDWNETRLKADRYFDDISKTLGIPYENVVNLFNAVFLKGARAVQGEYLGTYTAMKLTTSPGTYSGDYYDLLYKAYVNDPEAYETIYVDMVEWDQFATSSKTTEEAIASALENRMKKDQGVESVADLESRYLSPAQQTEYDRALADVSKSAVWRAASAAQRKTLEENLYDLTVGNSSGGKLQEKIDGGAAYGIDETDYLLYQLALKVVDQPTESGKLGSYTGEEVQAAIDMLTGLSDNAKAYLWEVQGKSEKSNPYR